MAGILDTAVSVQLAISIGVENKYARNESWLNMVAEITCSYCGMKQPLDRTSCESCSYPFPENDVVVQVVNDIDELLVENPTNILEILQRSSPFRENPQTPNLPKLHWWTKLLAGYGIFWGAYNLYTTWTGGDWVAKYAIRGTGEVWVQPLEGGPITDSGKILFILTVSSAIFLASGIGLLYRKVWAWYIALICLIIACLLTLGSGALVIALPVAAWGYGLMVDAPAFFNPIPEWLTWIKKYQHHPCSGCGARMAENAVFCSKCGQQFPVVPPPQPMPPSQPDHQQIAAQEPVLLGPDLLPFISGSRQFSDALVAAFRERCKPTNRGTLLKWMLFWGIMSAPAIVFIVCMNSQNRRASTYDAMEAPLQGNIPPPVPPTIANNSVSQDDAASTSHLPSQGASATVTSSDTQEGVAASTSDGHEKFFSPDRLTIIEFVRLQPVGMSADAYVSFSQSGVRRKLVSNDCPQWTPVWSPDSHIVALHFGTSSAGISPEIYSISEQSCQLMIRIDYDLLWAFAVEKGCIPQGTTSSHLYIRAVGIDPETSTAQVSVYGNGDRDQHGVDIGPFDIFVNYKDKSLSTSRPSRSTSVVPQPSPEVPIASDPDRALDTFVDAVSTSTLEEDSFEGNPTDWDLTRLRNAPYARHGYIFGNARLRAYFSKRTWYKPTTSSQSVAESHFSPAERANIALIQSYQANLRHRTP